MLTEDQAKEVRAVMKTELQLRKEGMERVIAVSGKKRAEKARNLLLDIKRFEDLLEEWGGDEGLLFWVKAQVSEGVSLKALCNEYSIGYGVMWAWLTEDGDRLDAFEAAKRGAANLYVDEVVAIADDEVSEANSRKVRIDTRFRAAGFYDKKRFGTEKQSGVTLNLGNNSLVAILSGMGRQSDPYVADGQVEEEVVEEIRQDRQDRQEPKALESSDTELPI